jgi:hypothetical protein
MGEKVHVWLIWIIRFIGMLTLVETTYHLDFFVRQLHILLINCVSNRSPGVRIINSIEKRIQLISLDWSPNLSAIYIISNVRIFIVPLFWNFTNSIVMRILE